jgi:hypothetical protein
MSHWSPCPQQLRISGLHCWTPSIGNIRSTRWLTLWCAISLWATRRKSIISALARALLREDAGFHAYQMLEAGVRQFGEWGNTEPGRHILVAVARYLAAHSPTERGWLQTADIAARLSRGDQLHADEPLAR